MEKNLTTGSIWKNIVLFSIPFLLSSFLQTLYGLADLFIIGLYCEKASITAVSIGSQIMHVLTNMLIGLSMGSVVLIGRAVGGNDSKTRNEAIGNTITLFALIGVALTALLLVIAMPIVTLMSTPEQAVEGTYRYLIICFAGLPFIIAYNIIAAIFRGMGDSKSPLYFVAIACVFNIGLDFLLIGPLGMGPAGAAFATVIAQAISVLISLVLILKMKMIQGLKRGHLRLKKEISGTILNIGFPITAQNAFIQLSFILITVWTNQRGLDDATAVGIVEKVITFLFLVPSSLLSSVSALCAQNLGANKPERARKTLYEATAMSMGFGLFCAIFFQIFGSATVGLFTTDARVIFLGATYLSTYVTDVTWAGLHFPFSGYFSACGRSDLAFVHNVISIIIARVPIAYYACTHFPDTLRPLGLAAPTGSFISCIICLLFMRMLTKKQKEM